MLGIPTVMGRLIQQAFLQVLTPIFDPQFFGGQLRVPPRKKGSRCGEVCAAAWRRDTNGPWTWTQ